MLVLLSWLWVVFAFASSFSSPSSRLVSPPLSPPSLSRRARWHCTDRRWHLDAPLCSPSSRPSVRPYVRPSARPPPPWAPAPLLPQRHFHSFVSSELLGDASSAVFALLLGSGQDEAVRFQIFRTHHSKRKNEPDSWEHLKEQLLSPVSILSLSFSLFLLHRRHFFSFLLRRFRKTTSVRLKSSGSRSTAQPWIQYSWSMDSTSSAAISASDAP